MHPFMLSFLGFLTGLIDSVVGGGGLISLPSLSIAINPGVNAIATNKIVGSTGALIALLVYARKGHLRWREGIAFCLVCSIGSMSGSLLAPLIPNYFFKYFIVLMCPVILYIVWNRERFLNTDENFQKPHSSLFFTWAFASGFYDGFFGPGGGTFMFLSLFLGTGYPLLPSIAISKLANTFSASTALITYAINGHVYWREGLIMASGMIVGSFIGASYASKNADRIIRPMLTLVVILLAVKLLLD